MCLNIDVSITKRQLSYQMCFTVINDVSYLVLAMKLQSKVSDKNKYRLE